MLGSARVEGAEPGPEMRAILERWADGEIGTEQLDELVSAPLPGCRWTRRAPPSRRGLAWPRSPYVYPGTQVLRNHFAIHDPDELARRENDASTARQLELQARPLPGRYDLPHLEAFHRHIFGDLYPWAGEIRTVAIAKGDLFALPRHIEAYLAEVLAQLPAENYLRGLRREPVIDRLRATWPRSTASTRSGRQRPRATRVDRPARPATASPGAASTPSATSRPARRPTAAATSPYAPCCAT